MYEIRLEPFTYYPGAYTYQLRKIMNFMLLLSKKVVDKNYIWFADENNEAHLVLYCGDNINVIVPSFMGDNDEYPVKYIECTCFNYNTNINSVTIPNGVVSIG